MVTLKCTVLLTLALGAAAEPKSVAHSEIGRGVTFYKDLARGVALTAEFASGSEGDVALKWKGRDGDIAYDASLAMPASGPLGSMAASASAKRGACLSALCREDCGYESNASPSTRPLYHPPPRFPTPKAR